jgi:hypothetical protein
MDKDKIVSNLESLRGYYKEKFLVLNEPVPSNTTNQKAGKSKGSKN